MFSLIVSIISIALVAVLTAASIFYGGDAMLGGRSSAKATEIIVAGEQIMAAINLHYTEEGVYPATLDDLVSRKYLRSIPSVADAGSFSLISSAHAQSGLISNWSYNPNRPHLVYMGSVPIKVCAEINKQSTGRPVVLSVLDSNPLAQCAAKNNQDPITVFRHSGSKDFSGLNLGPRMPEVVLNGALSMPGWDPGVCLHGCDTPMSGGNHEDSDGENEEPPVLPDAVGLYYEELKYYYWDRMMPMTLPPSTPETSMCVSNLDGEKYSNDYNSACNGYSVLNESGETITGVTMNIQANLIGSAGAADYSVIYNSCNNATLAPGQECHLVVGVHQVRSSYQIEVKREITSSLGRHLSYSDQPIAILHGGLDLPSND